MASNSRWGVYVKRQQCLLATHNSLVFWQQKFYWLKGNNHFIGIKATQYYYEGNRNLLKQKTMYFIGIKATKYYHNRLPPFSNTPLLKTKWQQEFVKHKPKTDSLLLRHYPFKDKMATRKC